MAYLPGIHVNVRFSRSVENLHLPQSVFAPSGGSHRPAFYAPWTSAHPSPFDSLGRVAFGLA
jgi:hypothetical protein